MAETAPPPSYVIAMGAVWPPLCLGAVVLRFYARYKQNGGRRWSIDDWLMIPALLLTWGLGILIIYGVASKGLAYPTPKAPPGVNQDNFSSPTSRNVRRDFYLFKLFQIVSLTCIKLSFVFFYRRIFVVCNNNRGFDLLTKSVIALLTAWGLAFFFSLLFSCRTQFGKYFLAINTVLKYCPHTMWWENTYAITDMIIDLVVFCLPLREVSKLKLTPGKKAALFGIFGLGALTIAASVIRMAFYIFILKSDFRPDTDNDLIITSGFYWSMLESGLALIAVNLPPIYSFVRRWRKARVDVSTRQKSYPTRSQWVRNLTNFRSVRSNPGPMFSGESISFGTVTHGEETGLEDLTPPPQSKQITVEEHIEVAWHDIEEATSERSFPQ